MHFTSENALVFHVFCGMIAIKWELSRRTINFSARGHRSFW